MVVIKRRAASYIAAYPDNNQNLDNKGVIPVDDGAATGATIIVAARSLKKRLIVALPVATKEIVKLLKQTRLKS